MVNKHGARIESDQAPNLDQEVTITVPASGNTAIARGVRVVEDRNINSYFEFAVELGEAENLWGVRFPPPDWRSYDFSR